VLNQLGQRELDGAEQFLPVLPGPLPDRLDVAADRVAARDRQRQPGPVRRRDLDPAARDLGFPVGAVGELGRPVQHPPDRQLGLPPPGVAAVGARRRIGLDRAPQFLPDELPDASLEERAEQGRDPRPAAVGLAHGL
jgi:hypothetical protein